MCIWTNNHVHTIKRFSENGQKPSEFQFWPSFDNQNQLKIKSKLWCGDGSRIGAEGQQAIILATRDLDLCHHMASPSHSGLRFLVSLSCKIVSLLYHFAFTDGYRHLRGKYDVIKWKHFPRYWPFLRGNSPATVEFPSQRPVTRSFDVFFDLHLNNRLSIQLRRRRFETPSGPLWRHCNDSFTRTTVTWSLSITTISNDLLREKETFMHLAV